MFNLFKDEFPLAKPSIKPIISEEAVSLCILLKELIRKNFSNSLKLYIFDSGSSGAAELELQLLFSPLYDLPSYSIEVTYDASEANILLITGLMTENMYISLEDVYMKLKEPKNIIIVGDTPLTLTAYSDTFAIKDKVGMLFPDAFYIKGSPPEPLEILEGLYKYLKKL